MLLPKILVEIVDIDDTTWNSRTPTAPDRMNKMTTGSSLARHTCPISMKSWLSLMFVALLSNRDKNRVAGRTLVSGGV